MKTEVYMYFQQNIYFFSDKIFSTNYSFIFITNFKFICNCNSNAKFNLFDFAKVPVPLQNPFFILLQC